MGYPRDLDEYTEEELLEELAQRKKLRAEGKCDYCQRAGGTPPCKFTERHHMTVCKHCRHPLGSGACQALHS